MFEQFPNLANALLLMLLGMVGIFVVMIVIKVAGYVNVGGPPHLDVRHTVFGQVYYLSLIHI